MTKKKLQLTELKVKSFVTVVDKGEQKTAKGGRINLQTQGYIVQDIGGIKPWTDMKTRVDSPGNILQNDMTGDINKLEI